MFVNRMVGFICYPKPQYAYFLFSALLFHKKAWCTLYHTHLKIVHKICSIRYGRRSLFRTFLKSESELLLTIFFCCVKTICHFCACACACRPHNSFRVSVLCPMWMGVMESRIQQHVPIHNLRLKKCNIGYRTRFLDIPAHLIADYWISLSVLGFV